LRAEDALESALAMYIAAGKALPAASEAEASEELVRPSALGMAKAALLDAMWEQGVGRAELARRLRWHLPQISHVLDLSHSSRREHVEAALAALRPAPHRRRSKGCVTTICGRRCGEKRSKSRHGALTDYASLVPR